jgi:hypothetical protein
MAEIDVLLSASLKRSAQPGDAAGVADAIRSRVDAGDTGAPAASSGFGGGVLRWLPWVGLIVVAGIAGGAAGAAGVFAPEPVAVALPNPPAHVSMAPTYSCPGGEVVGSVVAGSRVLAIQRSADDAFLAVRDPWNHTSTVWVSRSDVAVDPGQDSASIPVGACPVITLSAPVVVPPPVVVGPTDTVAPVIRIKDPNPTLIYGLGAAPYCETVSTIVVSAGDDVGIANVTATTTFPGGAVLLLSNSGATYVFEFSAQYGGTGYQPPTNVTIVITAVDTSGNEVSTSTSLTIDDDGSCVI